MSEDKIALEVAEAEFDRFAEAWDIDADTAAMDDKDREAFEQHKRKMVRKIISGLLVINDDGNPVYTLIVPLGETANVTFNIPNGAAYVAMDKYKDRETVRKMNAFMGSATKLPPASFSNMNGRDVKVCQAIFALFMGS